MATKRAAKLLIPAGVLVLMAAVVLVCAAQRTDLRGLNLHGAYLLRSGQQHSGDQFILANSIKFEPESSVTGGVTLIGNQVQLDGQIGGDSLVIARQLKVGDSTRVEGDLVVCADSFKQSSAAQITGEVRRECREGGEVTVQSAFESMFGSWQGNVLFRLVSVIIGSLMMGALAALGTAIFPQRVFRVAESIRQSPSAMGGMGCLTLVIAVGLTIVYIISLLLILPVLLLPFVIVGWLALGLANLLGWIAVSKPVGEFVLGRLFNSEEPPVIAAVVGGITLGLLTRIWGMFWFLGWIGALLSLIVGSVGLGAVVLTRLGARSYPQESQKVG